MKSKHLLLMLLLALLAPWAANAQSPLFSEDFESGSMPTGWTTDGSGSWSVSTGDYSSSTGAGQGSYNAKITHGTTGAATKLITPEIDLSSVASAELSFMHVQRSWAGDIDGLKVYYRTSSSGTWTLLEEYTSAYASWTTEEGIVLPNLSSTYQVAFEYIDHYGYGLGVDNVIITQGASCVKPTTLTATAPYGYDAAHCILLQWEGGSGSYNVQLKKASESEEQWQSIAGGFSDYALLFNTLDPLTTYNARVQSVCGGDVSDWKNVTFTTACAAISVDDDNNYTYGFEDAEPFECWTAISGTVTRISGTTHADSYRLDFRGTTSNMIAFPQFTNATNTLRVEFWTRPESNGGSSGKFAVGYMTNLNDASTFVAVETYNSTTWTSLDYVKKTVDLVSAPANAIIVFRQFDCSTNYYWYVDDVTVKPMPSCVAPTALNADPSTNSAELSWTANSGETAWTLYYKKTTDENYTEVANVTENPYTLPGLTAATNYQFYVVANCSSTDNSEPSDVKSFATECEAIAALGYTENFDSYTAGNNVLPTCWSYINTTTYTNYSYYPRINSSNAHSASNSLYLNSYYSSWSDYDPQPQYAILPEMTGLAGMQVALYAKGYNTSSTFKIGTMSNPNDASTFTMIAEQTLTTSYPADAYEYIIPTTCTDNYLAIMIDAATSTRTTNGVYIDDIDIHEPPSCAKPTNVTATTPYGHGATINWNAGNDETAWQICVIDNNVESAPIDVTSKPHTLSGLDPETTYQVKVRANCGGSFSEWTNAISFTTTVVCPAPTSLTGEANEFDATITWQGTASSWEVFYSDDNTVTPDDNIDGTATSTTYTKTGLPLGDHYFWVRAICGGEDGNSSWAGPVSVHIGYCVPNPTSHDGNGITGVTFGMGSNVVVNGDGNTSLPASSPYYGDYSSMIGAVQAGVESTISITTATGNYPYTFVIWVDLDNSLSFEDSEVLYVGKAASGAGTHNATITIPATQATGDYRMRIYGADSYFSSFYNNGSTNWEADHDPCATGSWRHAHDYTVRVLEAPSCLTPSNVEVTYTGGTSATISWTSEATAWNMRVNGVDVNGVITNPYTLTGLELATTYNVEVQANCGANGLSEWSTPVSFTTDLCQSENMCAINYSFTDQYNDSWNSAYMNIVDALTGEVLYQLTMPDVDGPYEGSFNVCDGRDIQFVWVSGNYPTECGYVFTDINDEVILEKATGTTAPAAGVVITHTVDCTIPTCAKPTAFAATNPGPHSIDLSWTENGTATQWQICVNDGVDDNITLISNTTSGVTVNGENVSYTLTGLDPETDYTVKVRAYCNATDQSNWSNEESFTTTVACPAPTNLNASASGADITVSWDGFASTYNIDINGTVTNNVTSPYTFTGELATEYEVKVQANCSGTTSEWTSVVSITTDLCLPANQCELTFELTDAWGDGWNGAYIDVIDVLTNTSLGHLANENLNGTQGSGENELNTKTLAVCDGREIQFVWNTGSYDSEASYVVTDVNGEEIFSGSGAMSDPVNYTVSCAPLTCPKPTDLTAGTLDGHSVDLSWTENGTATQWQICLNGDETQPVTANTNPFTLTGLDPETGYTVKVRAYCDATDQSAWSSEISFITDVACPAPTNLDATNITAQTATLEWNGTAAGEYEVRYAEGEAMQELYHNDGAYSTSIGLGGGEFEWGVMFPAGTYTENKLTKVSVYDQSAMTGTVNIYNDGATEPDATALVATKVIEFTGAEDWIDITFNDVTIDPTQNVWIIFDNVSGAGYPAAACADAAGDVNGRWVRISGTWYDLANAGVSGSAWMIRAIVENYDAYGSSVTTTDETYTLTNLTPATTYTAQVRAICGGTDGESAWVSTVFTTETFTMTKNIVANSWYALSSPVNTPNVTDVTNLTVDDYDFYRYNEVTSTWENYKAHSSSNFTTFENGRGYIYRRNNNATLTFTGVPNTATDYPYLLTAEGSGDLAGFNLLGNPYTTDYNYSGVCYNLTEKGTWKVNATGYDIPVCEAILIKVESETPCSFTSSKSAPKAAEALAFTVKGNGYEDVTYAMLEDGKGLNKVAHLADEAPALSIPVDGSNYAIAYLGYEVENFPLTLNATAGEYTIALNNQISGLSYCHLLDKVTGKETDLLKGAYTFKANGNSDRFTVLLNASLENGEIAIWNGNSWIVNGEGTLQVFDVMGRRVYNQEVAGQSSLNTDELATGVYVIRLGEKSQKIVVK